MEIKCMDCNCAIDESGKCMCPDSGMSMGYTQYDHQRDVRALLDRIATSMESIANTLSAMDRRLERRRHQR